MRHIERETGHPHSARSTIRADLLRVTAQLRAILERETGRRVGVSSFVGRYVRILHFPADVVEALSAGEVNITGSRTMRSERLGSLAVAKKQRRELLGSHAAMQGSQNRLRTRVKEMAR